MQSASVMQATGARTGEASRVPVCTASRSCTEGSDCSESILGLRPGVLFQAIVYGGSGYAEESWMVALGLADRQIPVQLEPVGWEQDVMNLLPAGARVTLERLRQERVDLARSVLYNGSLVYLWEMDTGARRRVGRAMFETDRIPDGWPERCNAMDEVWVASEFNLQTFTAAGVDPNKLRVIHAGVDASSFHPGVEPFDLPHRRAFNFLSVFDHQPRKGTDLLLRAFLTEFKADEDVALILKISKHSDPVADPAAELSYFIEKEVGLQLQEMPPIILVDEFLSQESMARLYASADAFVLPTHGEGYGRPFLESLACELPVIATRWSGQLDFLNDENSFLIDIDGIVPASVEEEAFAGHFWAQPSLEHLRQLMRYVYVHPEEGQARAKRGRQAILDHWDWKVAIPRWTNEFSRLLA